MKQAFIQLSHASHFYQPASTKRESFFFLSEQYKDALLFGGEKTNKDKITVPLSLAGKKEKERGFHKYTTHSLSARKKKKEIRKLKGKPGNDEDVH